METGTETGTIYREISTEIGTDSSQPNLSSISCRERERESFTLPGTPWLTCLRYGAPTYTGHAHLRMHTCVHANASTQRQSACMCMSAGRVLRDYARATRYADRSLGSKVKLVSVARMPVCGRDPCGCVSVCVFFVCVCLCVCVCVCACVCI